MFFYYVCKMYFYVIILTSVFKLCSSALCNNTDIKKVNGKLQRQASLPTTLPQIQEGNQRVSHKRHRHTDPGSAVTEALNLLPLRGVISEEQEEGGSGSPLECCNSDILHTECVQIGDRGSCVEILRGHHANSLNSEGNLTSNPETPQESSDSATSISAVSSCENSGGSIPSCSMPQSYYKLSPAETLETSNSTKENSSSLHCDSDKTDIIVLTMSNGQITNDGAAIHSYQDDLDMSVQSAEHMFPLSGVRTDAPTLPPRTYKIAAPPIPPRVQKTLAPPIPPRQGIEKPKYRHNKHVQPSLEPPPPLPPRTYSPVEFPDVGLDSEEGASSALGTDSVSGFSNDSCTSREQELFPWGPPSCVVSPANCAAHSRSPQPNSSHQLPVAGSRQIHNQQRVDTLFSSPSSTLIPGAEGSLKETHPFQSGHQLPPKPIVDGMLPGSRGSLALSTVSEPSASSIGGHQSDPNCLKRHSVDGLSQLTNSPPPRLLPRQRQMSTEERQLNRQQINQQLEQWTRSRRQKSNLSAPSDESSPPSFNECELSGSHEHLSQQLPPPPPFPRPSTPTGTFHRPIDDVDGQGSSSGRSIAHSQVSTSSNGSLPASSTSSTRERSTDRGITGNLI